MGINFIKSIGDSKEGMLMALKEIRDLENSILTFNSFNLNKNRNRCSLDLNCKLSFSCKETFFDNIEEYLLISMD